MYIFIPIKKHSSRVPNKNFRILQSDPLFKTVLKKLSNFRVVVDTDSFELITDIANDDSLHHVESYLRPEYLQGSTVSVNDLINHFINHSSFSPSINESTIICQMHVTTPFIQPGLITQAHQTYKNMEKSEGDSLFGATIIKERIWFKNNMLPVNHNPLILEPTQNLVPLVSDNSTFYMFTKHIFNKYKNRMGPKAKPYLVGFPQNIDIDTEEDWNMTKLIAGEYAD